MTSDVVCVKPDVGVETLLWMLFDHAISGVPVIDDSGKPVGIVSKTDLLRLLEDGTSLSTDLDFKVGNAGLLEAGLHTENTLGVTAGDVMCPLVYSVHPDSSLGLAAAMMAYEGVHRVPVVDDAGQLVGLLSTIDVSRWLGRNSGYEIPNSTAGQRCA